METALRCTSRLSVLQEQLRPADRTEQAHLLCLWPERFLLVPGIVQKWSEVDINNGLS